MPIKNTAESPTTVYIHIHGTTGMTSIDASASKWVAGLFLPHIFTKSTNPLLIPINQAPLNIQHGFRKLYQFQNNNDATPKHQYYYQWSGKLGEAAWNEACDELYKSIIPLINNINGPVRILMTAHSHGGQIARLFSAKLLENNIEAQIHIVTIATPLSVTADYAPMPDNVKSWLACYHIRDGVQATGSLLMQGMQSIQIARGHTQLPMQLQSSKPEESDWSELVFDFIHIDPHNALLAPDNAGKICDAAVDQWKMIMENGSQSLKSLRY